MEKTKAYEDKLQDEAKHVSIEEQRLSRASRLPFRVVIFGDFKKISRILKSVFFINHLKTVETFEFGRSLASDENPHFVATCANLCSSNCLPILSWIKQQQEDSSLYRLHCIWWVADLNTITSDDILLLRYFQGCRVPIISILYALKSLVGDLHKRYRERDVLNTTPSVNDGKEEDGNLRLAKKKFLLLSMLSTVSYKNEVVHTTCLALDKDESYLTFVAAQQEDPHCKFHAGILRGVLQLIIATSAATTPLAIPFSTIGIEKLAISRLCIDIIQIWDICPESDSLRNEILTQIPKPEDIIMEVGKSIFMIMFVPLWFIKGLWEVPAAAKLIIASLADVSLPMERMYYFVKAGGQLDPPIISLFFHFYKVYVQPKMMEYLKESTTFNIVSGFSTTLVYHEAVRVLQRFRYVSKSKAEDLKLPHIDPEDESFLFE
ncbi:Schizosaccharomyces specific protein [Schizosaccharomyces osmophilus]|uniref:Schizosaccharomyces specific protein n=1 Tax=Schizosaccharomyces osmophilus TaxID=2545709 RepID=A0AAE9WDT6_9SCHI|nr:Schizosaccharomyces specific protein [Schizosaccharomyces osmophilus]WBW73386.1 Schizosaccharomyces specific protein [Schizosaccharomyces osmophilus]